MTPNAAMIFAAGFGTRMKPLTLNKPKPMVEVAGKPMIDYAIALARDAGAQNIVSNLHYLPDSLRAHLETQGVQTITESPEILDTGGGLRNAMPLLGTGPVWTVNPDVIWRGPNPLRFALQHWNSEAMDSLLMFLDPARIVGPPSPGVFELGKDGQVMRGTGYYGGVQIVSLDRLQDIKAQVFSLRALWDLHVAAGRCYGCIYPGSWCDIGTPAGIPIAEQMMAQNV